MFSPSLHYKLLTVAEEFCAATDLMDSESRKKIDLTFAYSQENGNVHFTVEYGGKLENPLNRNDSISQKLLKYVSEQINYSVNDGKNRISGDLY